MEGLVIISSPKARIGPAQPPLRDWSCTYDYYPTPKGFLTPPVSPHVAETKWVGKKESYYLFVILSLT